MKQAFFILLSLSAFGCAHDAEKSSATTAGTSHDGASASATSSAGANGTSAKSSEAAGEVTISNDEPVMIRDGGAPTSTASATNESCTGAADAYRLKLKDAINACYREGKAKNPFLSGRLKLTIAIDPNGKGGFPRADTGSALGQSVVDCMTNAAKAVPFQDLSCKSKSITIVRTYGSD